MKITKEQLKQIIQEEIESVLNEEAPDWRQIELNLTACIREQYGKPRNNAQMTARAYVGRYKDKPDGYQQFVAFIKKKLPKCSV